jgi:hypothetical protein
MGGMQAFCDNGCKAIKKEHASIWMLKAQAPKIITPHT